MHMQSCKQLRSRKAGEVSEGASIKKVDRYLTDYLQATVVDLVVVVAVNNNNYH